MKAAVPLPSGIVLKVPDAPGSQSLGVLLQIGAPVEFLQRKVGQKSERFLLVTDSDGIKSDADEQQQATEWQQYRDTLSAARRVLRADPLLAGCALCCDDPLCWPPPREWKVLCLLRCEILLNAGQVAQSRALKEALLRHVSECEGSGLFPLVEELSGMKPVVYKAGIEKVASSQTDAKKRSAASASGVSVRMDPIRVGQTILTVDYTASRMMDALQVKRMPVSQTILAEFQHRFGLAYADMWRLHVQFYLRELATLFNSAQDCSNIVNCASGIVYTVKQFMTVERYQMAPAGMIELLADSAASRIRLRNGVYLTRVDVSRLWVIHRDGGDGVDEVGLSPEEIEAFQRGFGVKSFYDELLRGRVKWSSVRKREEQSAKEKADKEAMRVKGWLHKEGTASATQNSGASAEQPTSDQPQWESISPEKFPAPSIQFKKQVQVSVGTVVTEFVIPNGGSAALPAAVFTPGQSFFILHGPRVVDQTYDLDAVLAATTKEFEEAAEDRSARKPILQSLRRIAEEDLRIRKANEQNLSDEIVEQRLIDVFAKAGGKVRFGELTREQKIIGIPPPQLRKLLKKMGHYNIQMHCWIKH